MSDPRLHTHLPLRAVASCDYALTDGQFEEYVATADYMSKRKRIAWILGVMLVSFLSLIVICIVVEPPMIYMVFPFVFIGVFALASIVSLVTKRPPFWNMEFQRKEIFRIYNEALGWPEPGENRNCSFFYSQYSIIFRIDDAELRRSLEEIRWVVQKGDLVVVGILDGSKSLTCATYFAEGDGIHYKAVPAAAFLKSKLEGMDPDELIAILEEYAKKPKRPVNRKEAWK